MQIGFDSDRYNTLQSDSIKKRLDKFGGKLYVEVGGKIFDDYHATRILPGFLPDSKIRMFATMKDRLEAIVCINCNDIEKSKERGDLGITYDTECLRLISMFKKYEIKSEIVVMTMYAGQPSADKFRALLTEKGIRTYLHYPIPGYPADTDLAVSDKGYGKNEYAETTMPVVLVTAPGPGSGKMAVCLSQVYHENRSGIKSGYAKFETFPVWNLPLHHPVNLAYEAATVDLGDVNMIDPFHLKAYGMMSINYNRDVETFPVLKTLFDRMLGECPYKSPTDMGVNMVGLCISDDDVVKEASLKEIVRRYFHTHNGKIQGKYSDAAVNRIDALMKQAELDPNDFALYREVRKAAEGSSRAIAGIEIPGGKVVLGKKSDNFTAVSAAILNALKEIAGIDDSKDIILPEFLDPMKHLLTDVLGNENTRLRA
ncbi:MAG: DUF1846 domain-containing protein, partial [archaeon]|nr:DUF1846 domain-containing protein [archaeon]